MALIPGALSFLPDFPGRETLYSPLPIDESTIGSIRILTILPNEDEKGDLECSLQIVSLRDGINCEYNAISYFWGSTHELEKVIIRGSDNGKSSARFEVPVTLCLSTALRHFCARATANDEVLQLWTDALCIDQHNAQERSFQLSIMKRVFNLAASVWIWLGHSDKLIQDKWGTQSVSARC